MIELLAGPFRLVLDPDTGGSIAALEFDGLALLRPVSDPRLAAQHGRALAGYPLIPYANRIAWGRFGFAGQQFELDRNFGDHPHTIHGNAWMHPWTVRQAGDRSAHLTFDHNPAGEGAREWPFAYHAEQVFVVDETEISLTISVKNTDLRPWPAGLGVHPYVARGSHTLLRFEADTVWSNDADALPGARAAVKDNYEFDRSRPVSGTPIDNCYAGWGGETLVSFPDEKLSLRIEALPPFDHFQVYTPAGENFMGLEAVSNMPDAINRMGDVSDHGLRILAPGQTLHGTVRFLVDHL